MSDVSKKPVRVIMWCLPRTISSALAKCLSGIEGMEIWFEPFCYAGAGRHQFQRNHGEDLPMEYKGNEEAIRKSAAYVSKLATSEIIPERMAYDNLQRILENSPSKYVFVKDMAFAMPDAKSRNYMPSGYKHVFLIREPIRMYNSYRRAMYKQLLGAGVLKGDAADERKFDLYIHDIAVPSTTFYKIMHDLWKYVRENIDPNPIVLDADDLLLNPPQMLVKFCELTGLPYSDALLQWDASTDVLKTWKAPGDTVLVDMVPFYKTAMTSSYFMPPSKPMQRDQLSDDLKKLTVESAPYFNEMYKHRLTV